MRAEPGPEHRPQDEHGDGQEAPRKVSQCLTSGSGQIGHLRGLGIVSRMYACPQVNLTHMTPSSSVHHSIGTGLISRACHIG